ncbi:MAG: septal ring lytic transglycosylase RlpA family protein [Cytophagaceae bacterium]|nr:septal ring lytic transglycosylase RlpA family protein [Cytophagaceae bacterium]
MKVNIKKTLAFSILSIIIGHNIYSQHAKTQTGMASYYASKFHGKKTACGEKYDMYALTAAHNTLPFHTYVKVTNLKNNKTVIVRINDRGPHAKGRIIDLSKAAAEKIGLIQDGVGKVRIEVINADEKKTNDKEPEPDKETSNELENLKKGSTYDINGNIVNVSGYGIQVLSLENKEKLKQELKTLHNKYKKIYIEVAEVKSKIVYRIIIGEYASSDAAKKDLAKIKKEGHKGFVKKYISK